MGRARRGLFLAELVHLVLGATAASAELRLDGALVATDPPVVRVVARNVGPAPATDVTPTVLFEHRSYDGAPGVIQAGQQHEWQLSLPPPSTTGTFPASVRVTWRDPGGARHALPFVLLVSTRDAAASAVTLAWAVEPAAPVAHTRLSVENHGTRPLAGRIAVVLPADLATEPESQPVAVPANAVTTVPLALESRDAPPGTYPVYAVFTYTDGGQPHAALAGIDLPVEPERPGARAVPLAVGCTALVLMSLILAVALRASARSRS